jgi:hypothetical protein
VDIFVMRDAKAKSRIYSLREAVVVWFVIYDLWFAICDLWFWIMDFGFWIFLKQFVFVEVKVGMASYDLYYVKNIEKIISNYYKNWKKFLKTRNGIAYNADTYNLCKI